MPRAAAALALAILAATPARAEGADGVSPWDLCRRAIAAVEPGSGLPPGLLTAIALVESGRPDPARGGRAEPWPWAYNAGGESRFPESRAAALAEVAALLAAGRRSVDVGCMQVNLQHHPGAFRDLGQAFEPEANVRYAAAFLRALRARLGDWAQAIASYHSATPEHGLPYHRRVALARIGAALDAGGPLPLPAAAGRGLCAPGPSPVMVMRGGKARGAPLRPQIVCRRAGGRP